MTLFSYHLVKLPLLTALKLMFRPITSKNTNGLVHAETMSVMVLGAPIWSKSRFFSRQMAIFAQWEEEKHLEAFLETDKKGKLFNTGWHVRLEFVRQWGSISGFKIPEKEQTLDDKATVMAVTIARMKYTQIPRFLRWGRPVEKQVRDNNHTTLSLASIRYPNIISTCSIWKTQKAMTDMVHGRSNMPEPKRHVNAMKERNRKDFHFEFTTLRFKPLAEYGIWNKQVYLTANHTSRN